MRRTRSSSAATKREARCIFPGVCLRWINYAQSFLSLEIVAMLLTTTFGCEDEPVGTVEPSIPLVGEAQMFPLRDTCRYGYMTDVGTWAIAPRFHDAYPFSEGLAAARDGELFGYLDTTGAWAIEPRFLRADAFEAGFAKAYANEQPQLIDRAGRVVFALNADYDDVAGSDDGALALYRTVDYETHSCQTLVFRDGTTLEVADDKRVSLAGSNLIAIRPKAYGDTRVEREYLTTEFDPLPVYRGARNVYDAGSSARIAVWATRSPGRSEWVTDSAHIYSRDHELLARVDAEYVRYLWDWETAQFDASGRAAVTYSRAREYQHRSAAFVSLNGRVDTSRTPGRSFQVLPSGDTLVRLSPFRIGVFGDGARASKDSLTFEIPSGLTLDPPEFPLPVLRKGRWAALHADLRIVPAPDAFDSLFRSAEVPRLHARGSVVYAYAKTRAPERSSIVWHVKSGKVFSGVQVGHEHVGRTPTYYEQTTPRVTMLYGDSSVIALSKAGKIIHERPLGYECTNVSFRPTVEHPIGRNPKGRGDEIVRIRDGRRWGRGFDTTFRTRHGHFALPPELATSVDTSAVQVLPWPDSSDAQSHAFVVYNNSTDSIPFGSLWGNLLAVQEVRDSVGAWHAIEESPGAMCGNSYAWTVLPPKRCWLVRAARYAGGRARALRFKVRYYTRREDTFGMGPFGFEGNAVSGVYVGSVNAGVGVDW